MSTNVRQFLLPVLAALIWGIAFPAQDVCVDYLGSFTILAIREFLAVLLLLFIIMVSDRRKQAPKLDAEEKKNLLIGGFLCGTALFGVLFTQQFGMQLGTESGKAGFITSMYIVLVPLFGLVLGKKVTPLVWVAIGLSVIALYLLSISGHSEFAIGDLVIFGCAISNGFQILLVDHYVHKCDPLKLSCAQFIVVFLYAFIGMFIFEGANFSGVGQCWPQLLYLGILSSGIAFTLQVLAQRGTNPTIVSLLMSLEAVFAVIGGAVLLGQTMTAREYAGCALMFVAVILAQLPIGQKKSK